MKEYDFSQLPEETWNVFDSYPRCASKIKDRENEYDDAMKFIIAMNIKELYHLCDDIDDIIATMNDTEVIKFASKNMNVLISGQILTKYKIILILPDNLRKRVGGMLDLTTTTGTKDVIVIFDGTTINELIRNTLTEKKWKHLMKFSRRKSYVFSFTKKTVGATLLTTGKQISDVEIYDEINNVLINYGGKFISMDMENDRKKVLFECKTADKEKVIDGIMFRIGDKIDHISWC